MFLNISEFKVISLPRKIYNSLMIYCAYISLSLLLICASAVYSLDSNSCNSHSDDIKRIINLGNALDEYQFVDETKETIQLTWAGENSGVLILVTMSEGETGPGTRSSDIYRRSSYSVDTENTFYVLCRSEGKTNSSKSHILVKTTDRGLTWTVLAKDVIRVWAPRAVKYDWNLFDEQADILKKFSTPMIGNFLFIAQANDAANQTILLVSNDGGYVFHPVYLPPILADQFFSVLEVENDLAFVHVDSPNDTGFGTLFASDVTGRVFRESLRHHLYPNHAPITDFYRVQSMRGTYIATRLNPDRTLHTVITHNRGASWHPLPIPLDSSDDACKLEQQQTNSDTSSSEDQKTNNHSASGPASMHLETSDDHDKAIGQNNDTTSSLKVCGLQVSNQFSIKNRVIASPPLSIPAAPGLILVHGHVATHLKNTPADVFVSSDGGYSWIKALSGPHYYQIANRGGLIVAVPADTLLPEVLRFSTDEGRCWHTIPLRLMKGKSKSSQSLIVPPPSPLRNVHGDEVMMADQPDDRLQHILHSSSPDGSDAGDDSSSTLNAIDSAAVIATSTTMPSSNNHQHDDETVVFTGLVTEPGGRAMAAAVYGYGTFTQRWRVFVVDFRSNGMVDRICTADDYDTWTPHSSDNNTNQGCLLGIREQFRRLKKDSICVNEYGLDPLLGVETCPCTPEDFECEYGFYRELGSLQCIRNQHIDLANEICHMPEEEQTRLSSLGYRRIPGDRCVGGWEPPIHNQTILRILAECPNRAASGGDNETESGSGSSTLVIIASLITTITLLVFIWIWFRYPRSPMSPLRYNHSESSSSFPTQVPQSTLRNAWRAITSWWSSLTMLLPSNRYQSTFVRLNDPYSQRNAFASATTTNGRLWSVPSVATDAGFTTVSSQGEQQGSGELSSYHQSRSVKGNGTHLAFGRPTFPRLPHRSPHRRDQEEGEDLLKLDDDGDEVIVNLAWQQKRGPASGDSPSPHDQDR